VNRVSPRTNTTCNSKHASVLRPASPIVSLSAHQLTQCRYVHFAGSSTGDPVTSAILATANAPAASLPSSELAEESANVGLAVVVAVSK